MQRLSVIMPVYNEHQDLGEWLSEVSDYCHEKGCRLILVDDGSTDGSGAIVNTFSHFKHVTVLCHKLNKGYGAALKTGLQACQTEYAVTIDADGQHFTGDIERLFQVITSADADLVVGSRQNQFKASFFRGMGKRFIRNLARVLMTVPVHDLNSGMKMYRTGLAVKYLPLLPDTMAFSDIITLVFLNNRDLVLEEPIRVKARMHGKSAITLQTAFQTIMEVIHIVILFNPMKIFLPLSLLCFIGTVAWGLPFILHGRGVSIGSLLGIITTLLLFLLGLIAEQLSLIRRNQIRNN